MDAVRLVVEAPPSPTATVRARLVTSTGGQATSSGAACVALAAIETTLVP